MYADINMNLFEKFAIDENNKKKIVLIKTEMYFTLYESVKCEGVKHRKTERKQEEKQLQA